MFGYLPEAIKQQVLYYLQNDNFPAAKKLYDSWLSNNPNEEESGQLA
jgi:hypothetical protein